MAKTKIFMDKIKTLDWGSTEKFMKSNKTKAILFQ